MSDRADQSVSDWRRTLPNRLTILRLFLAAAFFGALNLWWYDDPAVGRPTTAFWANLAVALFIFAALTDALDGFLARRWRVESAFGRVMDPVCDKILVLGAFVYLAGPRFVMHEQAAGGSAFAMASGVYPWMVVIILLRELLVTGLRGVVEARGVKFASNWWGKLKMILQAAVIPVVIIIAANFDPTEYVVARIVRDVLVWLTLLVTVVSGAPYITRSITVLGTSDHGDRLGTRPHSSERDDAEQ